MKSTRSKIAAFSCFMVLAFSGCASVWAETPSLPSSRITAEVSTVEYLPKAATEAIQKSQGIFTVKIPLKDGKTRSGHGSAFLVGTDGLLVTALHNLPDEIDVVKQDGRVTFNGLPVEVDTIAASADIALLKLKSVPKGMEPAVFAKDVPLFSEVYAQFSGNVQFGDGVRAFRALPFRAIVVGEIKNLLPFRLNGEIVAYIPGKIVHYYLDKDVKGGFSGAMFVNEKGEVAGMGVFIDGGYTAIISSSNIQGVIEYSRQVDKEQKEKDREGQGEDKNPETN
jgi:hypothetical protein